MDNRKTFFGISIFKPRFLNEQKLIIDVRTASIHFSNLYILLADKPEIYNLIGIEGLDKKTAIQQIKEKSLFIEKILRNHGFNKIIKWEDFDSLLALYIKEVKTYLNTEKEFQNLFYKTIKSNLKHRYPNLTESQIKIAQNYLIEELAQTILFVDELKFCNEIYPGSEPSIKIFLFEKILNNTLNYNYINLLKI